MDKNFSHEAGQCSRRNFLKNAGLVMAAGVAFPALIPARALGRDGHVAPSNRVALGVIGARQGWDSMAKCLHFADVEGVAVCETDGARLRQKGKAIKGRANGKGVKLYKDFREMYANAKMDAVIIAAPDHWHGVMAVAAARAGIDVYGEKPLAHTLVEGRAIANAIKQHGRIWQTGSWQRSGDKFRKAVNIVRNGLLGKLTRIEVGTHGRWRKRLGEKAVFDTPEDYDMWVGPAQWMPYDPRVTHYEWRWCLNYGGGNLMDWVGHHVDIAHWGAGFDNTGPVKISGTGEYSTDAPYDAEMTYRYECTYANGVTMVVDSSSGTKFIGENGKWLYVNRGALDASDKSILNFTPGPNDYHAYKSTDHWRNFIDGVKTRHETITPAETAHRAASVGHLGHIAIMTGRTIHWDPVSETIKDDPGASALLQPTLRAPWKL
ncbi:MAG: Gfo/Idh/MocA family oxidoreductase [Puniceicoccales bacterium]|jgi:predicted dehydrogenase|nr:Gfo/Idh/MocA family oxidoreductase [Puniceicoccales bacterium]